jgi:addiction module HigA family antidote
MTIDHEGLNAGRVALGDAIDPREVPLGPVHPGEILAHDFVAPLGLSARALARALHVPANRITAILAGQRSVSAETALRLARYFGGSAGWWLRLQARYDEETAREAVGAVVEREVVRRAT